MKFKILIILLVLSPLIFNNCKQPENKKEYIHSVKEWRKNRLKRLKSEKGWLNLRGLFWLKEGENTFGSDSTNDLIFPDKAPEYMGKFILKDSSVSFISNNKVPVKHKKEPVEKIRMKTDKKDQPTVLEYKSLRWFVIERNGKYGIRLRDLDSPLLEKVDSVPSYPIKPEWRIKASFNEFQDEKYIEVPNVLGGSYKEKVPGVLSFMIENKKYKLWPAGSKNNLFLIFGDETNAETTYGGGRFLSVGSPDENNNVFIDFNKAYNPPCAFTPYATCPLPPRKNVLQVKIKAGEKAPDLPVTHH